MLELTKKVHIKITGKNTADITGNLTIRDITKAVVLAAQLQKSGKHPFFKRDTLGFKATTHILRSDYGLRAYLPDVGDKVDIEIQAEAIAPASEKSVKP